jgi:pimeloyl-ACP methyl ester carboxylesterase
METTQQIGAHKVKVWEVGQGSPVVFFYDGWHTTHGYRAISELLSDHHHVLALDPPGFGGSPGASDYTLNVSDYAALLGEFVRFAGARDLTLVLSGLGLPIGLNMLAEGGDPSERVGRVVITNGLLYGDQVIGIGPFKQGVLLSRRELPIDRVHHRRRLLQFYGNPNIADEGIMEDAWYAFSKGRLQDQAKLAKAIDDLGVELAGWRKALGDSEIPVLVLWGEEDPTGGRAIVEKFQEEVPQAETYMLPGVGHFPHVEVPEVMADGIKDFAKRAQRNPFPKKSKPKFEILSPDEPSYPQEE